MSADVLKSIGSGSRIRDDRGEACSLGLRGRQQRFGPDRALVRQPQDHHARSNGGFSDGSRVIRVGLIGASVPRSGWAVNAHVPAVEALGRFSLHSVATTQRATAEEAARAFGAKNWFVSASELINDPDVDLVVVAVKVTSHYEIVREALKVGKHVYCEWPLAVTATEAESLATLARPAGVVAAVGLQARAAPAVRYARALIEDGFIGELRSATLTASTPQPGGRMLPARWAWHCHRWAGLTVLTVPGIHALDALFFCVGEPIAISAMVALLDPSPVIVETGEPVERTADDHVGLLCRMANGAPVVAQIQGGSDGATASMIELRGTEGSLRISTLQPKQLQMSALRLEGVRGSGEYSSLVPPVRFTKHLSAALSMTPAENVAGIYDAIGAAIEDGAHSPANFDVALRRHRLIDAVERSSAEGTWETVEAGTLRRGIGVACT